jgi:hypothetical protein
VRQNHDLEDFLSYSDEEIAAIAAFLHGQEDATSSALPDNDDDEQEEEVDIATRESQLIHALTTFCVDGIFPERIEVFIVLQAIAGRRAG